MKIKFFILLLLSLFCLSKPQQLVAQKKHVELKDLDKYLYLSAMNNPNLRSKFSGYLTSLKRIAQVRTLPDPDLVFGYYILPIETRNGTLQYSFSLSQTFPFFGVLKNQKEAATFLAEAKLYEFASAKTELFYRVKVSWYKLYELREEQRVSRENLELLRFLEQLALKKYETGLGTMVDVLRVQLEIRELENEIQTLEIEETPKIVEFNTLLDRDPYSRVRLPQVMPIAQIDTTQLLDSILVTNSDIRRLKAEQLAAQNLQTVAKLNGIPSFRLGVLYGKVAPVEGLPTVNNGQDILLPSIGVNLPIYRRKYKAQKEEADYRLADLEGQEDEARNQLLREYEKARRDFYNARLKIDLYRKQIEQGKQALDLLIRSFSTAGEDFEEVLRMQRQILNYELQLVRSYVQNNIAVAEFERLVSEEE
jgi:outer membrane protein, heavy metal efflux system